MTILAAAAGLTNKLTFTFSFLTDGFTVSNLRRTDVAVHLEFTAHPVDDDVEVQLAHTGDDRLAGFFIRIRLERRIFFRQLR